MNKETYQIHSEVLREVRTAIERARKQLGTPAVAPLKIIAAVSGGQDSAVMLHVLHALREELPMDLFVAHVDHGLREDSAEHAHFVRDIAAVLELPFELFTAPARPATENLEAWARSVRYQFLEQCRRSRSADLIATAHHEHDQAETLLHRVISGRVATDSHNIAFMDLNRKIIRPLLSVPKEKIRNFAAECAVKYVEDESNQDTSRTRNRIRHHLIPSIEKEYNPRLVEGLSRSAKKLSEDESLLWELAEREFSLWDRSRQGLLQQPRALQWRLIALALADTLGEDAGKVGYRALSELCDSLPSIDNARREFQLGFGISCYIVRKELFFTKRPSK